MSKYRREIMERNRDVLELRQVRLMADTYLNRVKAEVVLAFINDGQFNGVRSDMDRGWCWGLTAYHLRTGLNKLRTIARQRITHPRYDPPKRKRGRPAKPRPEKQMRTYTPAQRLPDYDLEHELMKLQTRIDISHSRIITIGEPHGL